MTLFTVSRESWPGRLAVTSPLPQPQTVLTWELAAWHPTALSSPPGQGWAQPEGGCCGFRTGHALLSPARDPKPTEPLVPLLGNPTAPQPSGPGAHEPPPRQPEGDVARSPHAAWPAGWPAPAPCPVSYTHTTLPTRGLGKIRENVGRK